MMENVPLHWNLSIFQKGLYWDLRLVLPALQQRLTYKAERGPNAFTGWPLPA
jgi:hypothetical protein